ncbi:hypothetical protein [Flavobacterium sp.]|uniref:hypothetical protein n=1 Tax=Flavobacterium sp. TaxID=239 RepID=UPI003751592F
MLSKVKTKKCECGTEFKQYNSLKKYCSWTCEKKHKPSTRILIKKPIPKVSAKQEALNKIYSKLRLEFLSLPENQICPVSNLQSTEIHHKHSGKDRSKYFLDTTTWLAVSRPGHVWIHEHSKEAREKGLLF